MHRPALIGGFVLRCRCSVGRGINTGPQAKLAGYVRILSPEHSSAPRQLQRVSRWDDSFRSDPAASFLPFNDRRLGELALVLELRHKPHMCYVGDITTTMGASVHRDNPCTSKSL